MVRERDGTEREEEVFPDQTLLTRMRPGGESQSQFGDS